MDMRTASYTSRRSEIEAYFDRTAAAAWARLTSDAPLGRIRASVRAGRDRMRATLLECLPADLSGQRVLDAGCGTGALALLAAARGAEVVAIDLSPTLVQLARERAADDPAAAAHRARIDFRSGDMLDPALGRFDHVVAMDSLIHYDLADAVRVLARLAERADRGLAFTFAPRTPALAAMHALGRLFPRGDRAPSIVPVAEDRLRERLAAEPALHRWACRRSTRIASGFYTSQAMHWNRA
jgi:magnesium-protoporphyrin O-methyltransferase